MRKIVDIIIPAYKAQNYIHRALASIVMQTIVDRVHVTIVNDADGIGYKEIINFYSKFINIKEITLEENSGPGVARQAGIDQTYCKHIVFLDADDTFENAYALEIMVDEAEKNPSSSVIIFPFYEIARSGNLLLVKHEKNMIWVFGKIYNRNFIERNNIKFNDSRANEDVYFNTLIELSCVLKNEEPIYIDIPTYVWQQRFDSITRINNNDYTYNDCLIGYVENMHKCISIAKKNKNIFKQVVNLKVIEIMINLYTQYIDGMINNSRVLDEFFKLVVKFYDEHYSLVELFFPESTIENYCLRYLKGKTKDEFLLKGLTFKQFIDKIKEETNEE